MADLNSGQALELHRRIAGPAFSQAFLGPLAHSVMTSVGGLVTPTVTVMRKGNPPDYILRYPTDWGQVVLAAQYNATELYFYLMLDQDGEFVTDRWWGLVKHEDTDSLVIWGDTPYGLAQLHTLRPDVAKDLRVSAPSSGNLPELVSSIAGAINGYLYPPLPPRRLPAWLSWLRR